MLFLTFIFNLVSSVQIKASFVKESYFNANKNSSIQIIINKSSFWEASRFCLKEYSYNLATIRNKDDSEKLIKMLTERGIESAWIGLSDFGREGKHYWSNDHSSITFEKWANGFPKDHRNSSDCVLMRKDERGSYSWVDSHCASKHAFICMHANTTDANNTALLPPHSHYINQCPKPFSPVDGDCFWMSPNLLSWSESRLLCQSMSPESDLASIRTDFQQEYFAALISGNATGYWIGLNYHDDEYQWILQHDVKIKRWGENQPKDASKKMCTFIGNNEHNLGNWYTSYCSEEFYAICQTLIKNNDTETDNNNTNTADLTYDNFLFTKGACQRSGYYYYHGSCYRLHYDKQLNHNDAINLCYNETFRNKSGYNFLVELVSLPSAGEKNFILADLRKLGANLQNNNVWLNIRGNQSDVKNLRLQQTKKPLSLIRIKHLCFKLLTNGVVNSSDCDDNSKGIPMCKYQLQNFNIKSLKSNRLTATCPLKWTLFNSFCYFLVNETYQSLYEAKKSCLILKSSLLSIDMNVEQFLTDFLKKIMYSAKSSNVWIGLEARNVSDGYLEFNWSNENPVTYLNLESTNITGNRQLWCAIFAVKLGLWRLTNCTKVTAMVVCQQHANITPMQDVKKGNGSKKPLVYSKPTYIFSADKASWKSANNKCKALKTTNELISTLVTINRYSELQSILSKRKNFKTRYAWIGLSGLYEHFENVFLRWSDGSNVVFQNYQLENLMNLTGTENCVMIDLRTGKWLAGDCAIKRQYICRIMFKKRDDNKKYERKLFQIEPSKHETLNQACPDEFHQHFHKCYRVIEHYSLDWKSADEYCEKLIPDIYQQQGALASIESRYENSFVYSLLSSSMYLKNDTNYWIGDRYTNPSSNKGLCAGMSSHPDPYVGARWFADDCRKKRKFICSSLKIQNVRTKHSLSSCTNDDTEYNHSFGTNCYHFEDIQNSFEEARVFCNLQKSKSLLSLPSHYHLHFLLSQSERHGWSRDNPIWLGSEIEQNQKYHHWQWDNGEDVRYTIWNKVPNLASKTSDNLCLYLLTEKDKSGRFGIQIDECHKLTFKGYIICESIQDSVVSPKTTVNKNCLNDSRDDSYEGDMNVTVTGKRCIRWDLLKRSSNLISSIRNDHKKHNYIQYHSNECRYISDMRYSTTFCPIPADTVNGSLQLQECTVGLCSHKILHHIQETMPVEHHSNIMTVVIVTLLLLICVIACIALLSWRRWNKTSLFGGYLRRGQFSMLNTNQSRGTSFNNPIYSPINC